MIDERIIENLSDSSGVYIFKDKENRIVYIGKAKNIRERVKSYIKAGKKDVKTEHLAENIAQIETILTGNEKEAFLLENNLIKEHKPRYNINLKDDKTYISLKLTVQETFPALFTTRKIQEDGAMYFGPYPDIGDIKEVMKIIQTFYPVRRCKNTVFKKRKRACILFQMGKCPAPCEGRIEEEKYREIISELVDFLSGRNRKILDNLTKQIERAASEWRFEDAKALRDRYETIKRLTEKQNVHEHLGKDRDVWGFLCEEGRLKAVVLSFRRGVLISKKTFKEPYVSDLMDDAISSLLFQFYNTRPVPDEIILSQDIEDMGILENFLRDKKNAITRIKGQKDAASRPLVALAIQNLYEEKEQTPLDRAFKRMLHLRKEPLRIEAYDISHTHGKNPTGVMVVFESFKPKKDGYRVFHIRGPSTMDDTSSIMEVISRRLKDPDIMPLPDLFIIDGGKAQLSSALKVLKEMGKDIDIISIAKGEKRHAMKDLIYIPMRKNPVLMPPSSPVFKTIVKIRDEAHRFAISSHRRWKKRDDIS
ncbi:MAG TPA: excinuclease ABC subunit UvrC [Syntrophorhabdaceae bacterium]|nr:excinuclease ABC subunit UvrC [Syntrophorhabdaceae bacterium]HOL05639.1 excinuclease ABC subunit UvrC [Syntrophorhabdaceae bacterium]HON85530.1 excinuclease ABC subunit UvrC [Syntrophorhabdaceae bacterium]HOT42548.1 excinuclease ABC subunit UvrC [Syntrophorhabdaceae bacterium]HPC66338.1 excinuclease ABC subunit UvrC [Syntrophorhabdaceae bacterium]